MTTDGSRCVRRTPTKVNGEWDWPMCGRPAKWRCGRSAIPLCGIHGRRYEGDRVAVVTKGTRIR